MMQALECMLLWNVLWDFLSAYVISRGSDDKVSWRVFIASLHVNRWCDNIYYRGTLASFLYVLGALRATPLVDSRLMPVAAAAYTWEFCWMSSRVVAGSMPWPRLLPSAIVGCWCCVSTIPRLGG